MSGLPFKYFGHGTTSKICAKMTLNCTFNFSCGEQHLTALFSIQSNSRTHPREGLWFDCNIMLVAIGIFHDVYEEDVLQFFQDPTSVPCFPYRLTLRQGAKLMPVWVSADATRALTYNTVSHQLAQIGKALNWKCA